MEKRQIGTYKFKVEPFSEDFTGRIAWGNLGNILLRCAQKHASERHFGFGPMSVAMELGFLTPHNRNRGPAPRRCRLQRLDVGRQRRQTVYDAPLYHTRCYRAGDRTRLQRMGIDRSAHKAAGRLGAVIALSKRTAPNAGLPHQRAGAHPLKA